MRPTRTIILARLASPFKIPNRTTKLPAVEPLSGAGPPPESGPAVASGVVRGQLPQYVLVVQLDSFHELAEWPARASPSARPGRLTSFR